MTVGGALDPEQAVGAGKAVVNSPLVKTAVFGNDPNVGRILTALGDYFGSRNGSFDPAEVSISLGGVEVFQDGAFLLDSEKEERLCRYLEECAGECSEQGFPRHDRAVEICVRIGRGRTEETVSGADLSYDYIRENAEYRS